MPRQTRDMIDAEIVDAAASLFAQHGVAQTSLQRVADAVGYSKAGLLHHFPSKQALQQAVFAHCAQELESVVAAVTELSPGRPRDRAVVEAVLDLALRRPGLTALVLTTFTTSDPTASDARLEALGEAVRLAFTGSAEPASPARDIRIVGALGALVIVALTWRGRQPTAEERAALVATACDALGHGPA